MQKLHLQKHFHFPFTFFVILLAVAVTFFIPSFAFSFDISLVLTVIALLFAILIGFFFASATSNFLRFQTLITDEDATLMTLYGYAVRINAEDAEGVANAIDAYMIASLDYEYLSYAGYVHKELHNVISAVGKMTSTDVIGIAMLQNMQTAKMHLYGLSQEVALTSKRIVSFHHWWVISLLAGLMSVLLLSLRDGTAVTAFFIAVLLIAIFLTLKLLREVDSNRLLADQLSYENPQAVFEVIGKLPYYPETALSEIRIPNNVKKYRVGVYKNISKSFEKKIRVVTV